MYVKYIKTPLSKLKIVVADKGLEAIEFVGSHVKEKETRNAPDLSEKKVMDQVIKQLQEYISNKRTSFNLPLSLKGTNFQKKVWRALATTPYGKTVSYKDIARQIKNSKAVRAVGSANGKNPIPIIIPCHRVIAADGKLGGYSGGLNHKRWLLAHEQAGIK